MRELRIGPSRYPTTVSALVVGALFISSAYFFVQGTLTSFGNQQEYTFATDGVSGLINIGNGLEVDGKRIYLENLHVGTTCEGCNELKHDSAYAIFHVGERSVKLYPGDETAQIGNWKLNVEELKACYQYQAGFGYDRNCASKVQDILYGLELNVSKNAVDTSVSEIIIEKSGPGRKVLKANLTVDNEFGPVKTSRMYAEVFGQEVNLDSGLVKKGEHLYQIRVENSYYDPSKFLKRETVQEQIVLHFEDPRIPQNQVSGKPDTDGDMRTYERFEPGGSKPSIQDLEEGDERYSDVDSPCIRVEES